MHVSVLKTNQTQRKINHQKKTEILSYLVGFEYFKGIEKKILTVNY